MQVCAIVDGFSTGASLPFYFSQFDYKLVHIQSSPQKRLSEIGRPSAKDYIAFLSYEKDLDKLIQQLERFSPQFILPGSEPGVELAAEINERMGLIGNSVKSAKNCRDKYLTQDCLDQHRLRSIAQFKVQNIQEGLAWSQSFGRFPQIVKPVSSGGGDHCVLCYNVAEVEKAIQNIFSSDTIYEEPNQYALIQEYISGTEFVINTVSYQGTHFIESLYEYHKPIFDKSKILYEGIELIDSLPESSAATDYIMRALSALDVQFGAAHSEIKIHNHEPCLIECNARLIGASFPQEILKKCIGHCSAEITALAYAKPSEFLEKIKTPWKLQNFFFAFCFVVFQSGKLIAIKNLDKVRALPSFLNISFPFKEGDLIQETTDFLSAGGYVHLFHKNRDQIKKDFEFLREIQQANGFFQVET